MDAKETSKDGGEEGFKITRVTGRKHNLELYWGCSGSLTSNLN